MHFYLLFSLFAVLQILYLHYTKSGYMIHYTTLQPIIHCYKISQFTVRNLESGVWIFHSSLQWIMKNPYTNLQISNSELWNFVTVYYWLESCVIIEKQPKWKGLEEIPQWWGKGLINRDRLNHFEFFSKIYATSSEYIWTVFE